MRQVNVDYYECEVCGTAYETREQALACEAAGRPEPKFEVEQQVRLVDNTLTGLVPDGPYQVQSSLVQLKTPAWAECAGEPAPAGHMVTYVVNDGRWRLSFVPEEALAPVEG